MLLILLQLFVQGTHGSGSPFVLQILATDNDNLNKYINNDGIVT